MKIAILTLPLHSNYGGIIQNYALQTVLERMGHEVYTINLNKPLAKMNIAKAPISIPIRFIKKLLGRKDGVVFFERKKNHDKLITEQFVRKFINEKIHLTKNFYTKKDLKEINEMGFETIIVGSDQVWRASFAYPDISTYFLEFITNKDIKKLAFSASFGTDDIEFTNKQIQRCGSLIKDFDFISVREKGGLDLIKNKYQWKCKNEPIHTLDPTMLLTKDDYTHLYSNYRNDIEGELFYYILDMTEDKKKTLEQISNELGYKPFTVMSKSNDLLDNPYERIAPPLELWLKAFEKAKYVFTDSFHGTVFSILFHKDLIIYGNKERGMSRFKSLLDDFPSLKDKLIQNAYQCDKSIIYKCINWDEINNILEQKRNYTLSQFSKYLVK